MGYQNYLVVGYAALVFICLTQGSMSMSVRNEDRINSGNELLSNSTLPNNSSTTATTTTTTIKITTTTTPPATTTPKTTPVKRKTITITCKPFCGWNFKKNRYSRNCNARKFIKYNLHTFCKQCQNYHCVGTYLPG